jgi:predicted small secreted protein
MIKKIFSAVLVLAFIIALTGCHTVHGMGRDVESVGHSIEKATD